MRRRSLRLTQKPNGDFAQVKVWGKEAQPRMRCSEAKNLFSPYLDGALSGKQMQSLQEHLATCAPCAQEYQLLRRSQKLLVSVGKPKVPADLGLKLRVAISHEAARSREPWFEGLSVRLENALQA